MAVSALAGGLGGRGEEVARTRLESAMSRRGAEKTQSDSEAIAGSRWLRLDERGCRMLERSGDAAGAERAGQKLLELQRATTVWIGNWERIPRCEESIIQGQGRALRVVLGQWGGRRRAGGVRSKIEPSPSPK